MTEKKHTPGPWIARKTGGQGWVGQRGWAIDFNEDQEQVVDFVYEEADAKLIAAAPDLLAAAQKTVDAWAKFIDSFSYVPGIGDRAEDMEFKEFRELRAAIAKATQ
ncbi:hypothetical protein SAMN05660489_04356 [Pseudomonas sp. LAMO17WK12:I10]|uniref:hypothetical protein n=1 Tax=unclassified Pseudomonas TaxID=196821 RepID=UPI000BD30DBB|nr:MULTISPECIES: hypothetical protein [unclassified Pseudomonas]PXX60719.1 hypothetical protein H160_04395 [Pseudomonas sp. LAMO17WK12:I9]SNY45400.1 hypothetical protein SAMN05660489_04356 [Pseudomonas sp. LAMO17WK12:I10]